MTTFIRKPYNFVYEPYEGLRKCQCCFSVSFNSKCKLDHYYCLMIWSTLFFRFLKKFISAPATNHLQLNMSYGYQPPEAKLEIIPDNINISGNRYDSMINKPANEYRQLRRKLVINENAEGEEFVTQIYQLVFDLAQGNSSFLKIRTAFLGKRNKVPQSVRVSTSVRSS